MERLSLQQLDYLVKSGIWAGDPMMMADIFEQYLRGIQHHGPYPNFGTVEYWDAFLGPDDDEMTGGAVTRSMANLPGPSTTPDETYQMTGSDRVSVKKFKTEGVAFGLQFLSDKSPLRKAFGEAINRAFVEGGDNALVGMDINHPGLQRRIYLPFSTREKLTVDNVLNLISAVLQSAAAVEIGGTMTIKVVRINRPLVGGRSKGFRLLGAKSPALALMDNKDNMCLARSIVYSIARLHQHDSDRAQRRWDCIKRGDKKRNTAQRIAARELLQLAGVDEHNKCGIQEVEKIQAVLPDYQIKIWNLNLNIIYEATAVQEKKIHLLFTDDDHCKPILSMTSFLERNYFCEHCNVGFNNKEDHRCKNICKYCLTRGECARTEWVKCDTCRRRFPCQECYDQHKTRTGREQLTTCDRLQICGVCGSEYVTQKTHHCGQQKCGSCKQYDKAEGHQWRCWMQQIRDEVVFLGFINSIFTISFCSCIGNTREFVLYNFIFQIYFRNQLLRRMMRTRRRRQTNHRLQSGQASRRSSSLTSRRARTTASLPTASSIRQTTVWFKRSVTAARTPGVKTASATPALTGQLIFEGDDTTEQFTDWLFRPVNRKCVVMAHNFSGFDGQFLLEHITARGLKPNIINRGLSILTMTVEGIKFLDSFSFLPMALAALPKAFGFDHEVLKGDFPHYFNTKDNQNYVGPFPAVSFFGPDEKKPEARAKFLAWYDQQKGKEFDFRVEMLKYCTNDVTILRRAALEFRRTFIENTTVDPFLASSTIASACSLVYRKLFLKPNTLGIVPHEGYRRVETQSVVAIQWMKWLAHSRHIKIQHARNIGEKAIGPYKVDGYCPAQNKVFEFNGCIFHGCQCIENRRKRVPGSLKTMDDAYNNTRDKEAYIRRQGYDYEEIWNCEYDRQLREDDDMADYINGLDLVLPLSCRGAFFGGRTNAVVLEKKVDEGERIEYADFVSLYPTVLKNRPFPLGHPDIVTEHFEDVTAEHNPYFGLIKCEVLPPRALYHPVLPVRCQGKLMFPLCRTCAVNSERDCTHTDDERLLKGEWVTVELDKALAMGYKLHKIHEVWTYDRVSDPKATDSLFGQYVDCFLKLKAESSGYPAGVRSEDEKEAFVADFYEKEGVMLDKDKITKNPGLRVIAKLCLNSFWGKFGQRNNLPKTEYFTTAKAYSELVNNPAVQITGVQFCGEETICVNYRVMDQYVEALPNTNPVIAAFTTAWARLELYGCLERLDRRVLYFDTDSVIYTAKDGEWRPKMGEKLGEMTDELAKDYGEGAYCDHFLGAGPKNYAMSVVNGDKRDTIVKVRGFSVNYKAAKKINFDTIRDLMATFLTDGTAEKIPTTFPQITRNVDHVVLTKEAHKDYRIVYSKRYVIENGYTLPFGY